MSYIFVLYLVNILFSVFLGISVFQKYKNLGGLFFCVFTLLFSSWLFVYTLNYSSMIPQEILYTGRISYLLSFLSLYSFLFFVIFFQKKSHHLFDSRIFWIFSTFLISSYLFIFTPIIVSGVSYNPQIGDYYEVFGGGYYVFVLLSIVSIFLSVYFFQVTFKKLGFIDKMRFLYIAVSLLFFFIVGVFCLLVLPIFEVRVFEHGIIIFYFPFLLSGFYVLHRYYLIDFRVVLNTFFSLVIAILLSISGTILVKNLQIFFTRGIQNFWEIQTYWSLVDIIFCIFVTFFLYFFLSKYVFKNYSREEFQAKLAIIKRKLPHIFDIFQFQKFLVQEFHLQFGIQIDIHLFSEQEQYSSQLCKFYKKTQASVFIYDIVFLEENKHKFHTHSLIQELNEKLYLYFCLYDKKAEPIGYIAFSPKPFRSVYYASEISDLQDFIFFIMYHLQYLEFYNHIQKLNFDLDRRVDEKTMQFNQLVNKQKEFIQVVSHELSRPVTNALLLLDMSISQDATTKERRLTFEDTQTIFGEIKKAAELLKTIFRVEKYDIQDIRLFREKIDVSTYLGREVEIYRKTIVGFTYDIAENLGLLSLDQVQMGEVLGNLIHNSQKFANSQNPKIFFHAYKEKECVYVSCEDNGVGDIPLTDNVFQKYYSQKSSQSGLGLGLYLCRRIVELHGWSIYIQKSQLGGAKFTIKIPL